MIEQISGDFLRRVEFAPAYDCRVECKHEVKGDHGQHCVDLLFLLIGPAGATQFRLFTGWVMAHVSNKGDWRQAEVLDARRRTVSLMPADLGYHAYEPQYEGQEVFGHCEVLSDVRGAHIDCYYDGSGLNAERPFWRLVSEGDEGVWDELMSYYRSHFDVSAEGGEAARGIR